MMRLGSFSQQTPSATRAYDILPRSHDMEHHDQKRKRISHYVETTMYDRQFEPVKSGHGVSRHCRGTRKNEERRQAGTPATLEGNIGNTIDSNQDTGDRPGTQAYRVRWLVSHYPVSAAVSATTATKVDMRGTL
jgi:hypothetical protein